MDPDTEGAARLYVDTADAPRLADVQPAAFIAALDEHRALVGTAHSLAVLVIRLDRFQHVCETIGLQRAGKLRAQVKSRVAGLAAMPAVMHWLGPADLGVACVLDDSTSVATLSGAIAAALGQPYRIDGFELFLSSSIGGALDHPESSTERNLQQAFDAMLQVCRRGGDGIGSASAPTAPRLAPLLAALPHAIARGEFALHLQPRAMIASGAVTGYSVRLRWQHAVLGRVAPQDFLPAAEALGMMHELGRWILQSVLPLLRATEAIAPCSSRCWHRARNCTAPRRWNCYAAAWKRLRFLPGALPSKCRWTWCPTIRPPAARPRNCARSASTWRSAISPTRPPACARSHICNPTWSRSMRATSAMPAAAPTPPRDCRPPAAAPARPARWSAPRGGNPRATGNRTELGLRCHAGLPAGAAVSRALVAADARCDCRTRAAVAARHGLTVDRARRGRPIIGTHPAIRITAHLDCAHFLQSLKGAYR